MPYPLFFPESFQGNGDGKNSFPVGDAGDGDGAVVRFHGAFHDGKAQARSPDFRGVVGFHPVKAVEKEGDAFRRNAHARIRDGDDAAVGTNLFVNYSYL